MWAVNQVCQKDRASLVRDARDYALLNGHVLRYDNINNDNFVGHIPFVLFPTLFPRALYQECLDVQLLVNKLMIKIANDASFIEDTLGPIAAVDGFTKNLLELNRTVTRNGLVQSTICCISRADYMLDQGSTSPGRTLQLRQVEVNAIASGMAAHSSKISSLHKFIMSKYQINMPNNTSLPENRSLDTVAHGLIEAYSAYGSSDTYILLVAEERSNNFSDHFLIELEISKRRPDIRIIRRRFIDLFDSTRLGPNQELYVDDKEVALIYFRYCYDPSNYNFDRSWDLRLLLERSKAIKCPSINFHLAGAKKFQQVLNTPQQLERYLEPNEAEKLSGVYSRFWSLDDESLSGNNGYKAIMAGADNLVLKPQREGGGHNIFGRDVKPFLESIASADERSQYILMDYIDAPFENNWLLLPSEDPIRERAELETCDQLISELGVFGSILGNMSTGHIISSNHGGYLLRSKKVGVNEGGVACGYAGLGSLILSDLK